MPDNRRPSEFGKRRFGRPMHDTAARTVNDDMLAEFSDGENEFYVDESAQSRRDTPKKPQKQKSPRPARERKPVSPLQRKIRRIVSYCLIVAVVLIVGVVLSLTVLFKTQAYEVTGTERYTASELAKTCGISEGDNIFLAPKAPAEKRIRDAYPYVEEVDVSFKIPDTIKISVTEAVEGYLVKVSDAEYLLISTKGRILNKVEDISSYDLPIFIGPSISSGEVGEYVKYEDETVMEIIDEITEVFADNGYQGITEIDATDPADSSFTYDSRIKVRLGLPEDLSYKIRTAMTIINENIDVNTAALIEGVLDVSRCNVTKKSYFDETPLIDLDVAQDPTDGEDSDDGTSDGVSDDASGEMYGANDAEPDEPLSVDDWYL